MSDHFSTLCVKGLNVTHRMESVRIRIFSGPYFPVSSVSLRIQSKCWKIRTRKTPNTDTFHVVQVTMKGGRNSSAERSNCLKLFFEIGVPKNVAELTRKDLCLRLFY